MLEIVGLAEESELALFGGEIGEATDQDLNEIFADVPSVALPRSHLEGEGWSLLDALVAAGLAASKSAARRTIQQGGAYVNNRRIQDVEYRLTPENLASPTVIVLRSGKKKYALLKFQA